MTLMEGNDSAVNHSKDHQHDGKTNNALHVPADRIVSVEHPCIIRDVDKGLRSLGGEAHVKKLLLPSDQVPSVIVSLRPDDPLAKRLTGKQIPVDNLLLRITLPKRTGRKRKRGTDDPFIFAANSPRQEGRAATSEQDGFPIDSPKLLRQLKDNVNSYQIQPVGFINETHRFRTLPDFQLRAGEVPIMKEIAKHLLDPTLAKIKSFNPDMTIGSASDPHIVGPPQGTTFAQPTSYQYLQNPAVSTTIDEHGNATTVNLQKPPQRAMLAVATNVDEVPQGPPPKLAPLESNSPFMQQAVKNLQDVLDQRPIVTRRVAVNLMSLSSENLFKDATQYVCYSFKSGPWRDALIRYGVDPRREPKYRFYQTLTFQMTGKDRLLAEARKTADGKTKWLRYSRRFRETDPSRPNTLEGENAEKSTHIFDGRSINTGGKTWQVCDITDPVLHELLHTDSIREACDLETWGWYHNGTLSSARAIMRDKIHTILQEEDPNENDDVYKKVLSMPSYINKETLPEWYVGSAKQRQGDKLQELTSAIRSMAKADEKVRRIRDRGEMSRRSSEAVTVGDEEEDVDDDDHDALGDLDAIEREMDMQDGDTPEHVATPETGQSATTVVDMAGKVTGEHGDEVGTQADEAGAETPADADVAIVGDEAIVT